MKSLKIIFSETAYLISTKSHVNVSGVNLYQILSSNFDPMKNMDLADGAYFPYIAYNEIFKNPLFLKTHLWFQPKFP